jgi:ribosomal protein L11 methyltransferase
MFELCVKGPAEFILQIEPALVAQNPALKKANLPNSNHVRLQGTEPDEKRFTAFLETFAHALAEIEKRIPLPADLNIEVRHLGMAEPSSESQRWTAPFQPIAGLTIYPWQADTRPACSNKGIFLAPGDSFGTGRHPSTQLCLKLLHRIATQRDRYPRFAESRILDIGCGTGILAIAAAKMGAPEVVGLEIDPQAVEVATGNVQLNQLTSLVSVIHGSWEQVSQQRFDLIVANLTASVLLQVAGKFSDHLQALGTVVAAGFQEPQIDMIQKFLQNKNLMVQECITHQGWAALLLRAAL